MNVEQYRKNIQVNINAVNYLETLAEPNEDGILEITPQQRRDLVNIYKGLFQSYNDVAEKYKGRYIGTNHNIHFIEKTDG